MAATFEQRNHIRHHIIQAAQLIPVYPDSGRESPAILRFRAAEGWGAFVKSMDYWSWNRGALLQFLQALGATEQAELLRNGNSVTLEALVGQRYVTIGTAEPTTDRFRDESLYIDRSGGISLRHALERYGAKTWFQYDPAAPFETFKQEKRFRSQYGRTGVVPFGHRLYFFSVPQGIRAAVQAINRVPFLYTTGEMDSGTPRDYGWEDTRAKGESFSLDALRYGDAEYAPEGHAGFIVLRADEGHPDYPVLVEELGQILGVRMARADPSSDTLALRVEGDRRAAESGDIRAYQRGMEARWHNVLVTVQRYAPKEQPPAQPAEYRNDGQEGFFHTIWRRLPLPRR